MSWLNKFCIFNAHIIMLLNLFLNVSSGSAESVASKDMFVRKRMAEDWCAEYATTFLHLYYELKK